MKRISRSLAALLLALLPIGALAWGPDGHLLINRVAAEKLPEAVPAFVRSPQAVDEIASLGPEEDRIKGAGESWDEDNDAGHFLDLNDDGTIAGVVKITALPGDLADFAQALEKAGTTPYKQGFLPYTIMDGFERVRKDFAYWRVLNYLATHAQSEDMRAKFAADRELRETLTLRDVGVWGHYVADGSQPLHVTVHFNGWGAYPNPKGYSTSPHTHAMFESDFVRDHVKADDVRARIASYASANPQSLSQSDIASIVGGYLMGSANAVPPLYDIEAAHGFEQATPGAVAFTVTQLARGATMLRDLVGLAWEDSANQSVGYPPVNVRDVLSGKVVPTPQTLSD